MRITEFYRDEPKDPSARKRRLEVVLSAWGLVRLAYGSERGTPPQQAELTTDEFRIWRELLGVAEPVPPRTHVRGLETYVRLRGRRVDDLIAEGVVSLLGDRVALRHQAAGLGYFGHSWSLVVPAEINGESAETVLRKRFDHVEVHGEELLASSAWFGCTDTVPILVQAAIAAESPAELVRTWELSVALNLDHRLLRALPAAAAQSLANALGALLTGAAERLTVDSDIQIFRFELEGKDQFFANATANASVQLPDSRFRHLLETDRFFARTHHRHREWYYDAVASAFAEMADDFALGNMLTRLPVGSALNAALITVWLDRPEVIATYVWHRAYRAEGAFALIQLPQTTQLGSTQQVDFDEEWIDAQRLGRELLLLGEPSADSASLLALGIHDAAEAIRRRHQATAVDRTRLVFDAAPVIWARTISEPTCAGPLVSSLAAYLVTPAKHGDAPIVFSLGLLRPLGESNQTSLVELLAKGISEAYVMGLALDVTTLAVPRFLAGYGELLSEFRNALTPSSVAWRAFLRPFDAKAYFEQARADSEEEPSGRLNALFEVPRIVRAHAEVLLALAAASDAPEEPLRAALELCEADQKALLSVRAFSWVGVTRHADSDNIGDPFFVTVGKLIARLAVSPAWLDVFLAAQNEAHVLASLVAGIGPTHPLAEALRDRLRAAINALLSDPNGVALGHALELANLLQQADMPRDSERFARRALEIVDAWPAARDPFTMMARALLAGALAQQELWPEVLALSLDQEPNTIVLSPEARFIANMRALALMESDRLSEAEEALEHVLRVDPRNPAALVNRTSLYLHAKDWQKVVSAAADARPLLAGEDLDRLTLNEAHAREQLGDRFGAIEALNSLGEAMRSRRDVAAAHAALQQSSANNPPVNVRAAVAPTPAIAFDPNTPDAQAKAPPPRVVDSVDVAIITALREEYEAIRDRLTDWRDVPGDPQYPNIYAWVTGNIPKADKTGTYRVVVAWAGSSGNLRTSTTTTKTIDRWLPRYVLFSGIAGGLPKDNLRQGDLVLSNVVWHYEYGKVDKGTFKPRHRDSFRSDPGLLTLASTFATANAAWKQCGVNPPILSHDPRVVPGMIGSGEKVIDDKDPDFVRAVLEERPELQALEMEGAGASHAVEIANAEGKQVGFLMVRGISDMPGSAAAATAAGTAERDNWKPYVSALAANFIVTWIATSWPVPPRSGR